MYKYTATFTESDASYTVVSDRIIQREVLNGSLRGDVVYISEPEEISIDILASSGELFSQYLVI